MKKVGDSIEWNTKYGTTTGTVERIHLKARYIAKIDGSDKYMDLIEDVEPSELRAGDPNVEFVETVRQMREAQNRYFKTRDIEAKNEAMRLEKKVDTIIDIYGAPNLFNDV